MLFRVNSLNSLNTIVLSEVSDLRSWEVKNKTLRSPKRTGVSSFTTLYICTK